MSDDQWISAKPTGNFRWRWHETMHHDSCWILQQEFEVREWGGEDGSVLGKFELEWRDIARNPSAPPPKPAFDITKRGSFDG